MAKQTINIGTGPNTKTGDPLRTAFNKINQNFTELYDGTGGGNTGAITFEGIAIIGDTTDLPQGSIELVPNSGTIPTGQPNEGDLYTSWGQYLRIYPTWNADAPHIHIAAGSGENSAGDLFLGNDLKYVQVNHNGTISIGNSIGEWKFYDAEGMSVLELPNNTTTTPTAEIIHRHGDLNIRTTRTSFGIDADIGIYSADDLWLTAEGDEVEITAANDIRIYAANSEMDTNIYSVTSGTWAGTTLTFTAQDAPLVEKMSQYLSNTYSLWFEIQDGSTTRWIETYTTSNVNATVAEFPTYTAAINENNTAGTYTVLSVKTREPNYNGSKQWDFERNGKLSLPMGGAIEPVGMGWTGLTNGTIETPVSIINKTAAGDWLAVVNLWGGEGSGNVTIDTYNQTAETSKTWDFRSDGGLQLPTGGLGILKTIQSVNTGGLPPIDITGNVVFADANAAGDHITLLLPQSPPTGAEVTVKNINGGGFSVNVLASTDDTVAIEALDGTISTTASGILYGSCHATWIYDGDTWRIIDRYTT